MTTNHHSNLAAKKLQPGTVEDFPRRILMHSPDITLKGKNQDEFQRQLVTNVKQRLCGIGLPWPVGSARGRIYVDITGRKDNDVEKALNALKDTAGVSSLAATDWLHPKVVLDESGQFRWEQVESAMVKIANTKPAMKRSFKVHINRVDKRLPVGSQAMAERLGNAVRGGTDWNAVNLNHPDQVFYIDAYPDGLYLYADKIRGIGGLPVETGGRVLGLLSGGIDSPVAAYMMAKRGCHIDLLHITASHIQPADLECSVVARLAREVSRFSLHTRLYLVPYTYFDLALAGDHAGYELVLFRRFLMRVAEALAERIAAAVLVTGDSLGQVASQTMENLVSASQHISIPILRPLIGFNKQEIIELARRIGTYDISIEPYKDCCSLIGKKPRTKSTHEHLAAMEAAIFPDYERLMADTLNDMLCLQFDCGKLVGTDIHPTGAESGERQSR